MADNQVIEITPTGEKVIVKEVVKEVIVYKHYKSKCLGEAQKRYAKSHPEKINEAQRKYYQKNKERLTARRRELRALKKQKVEEISKETVDDEKN